MGTGVSNSEYENFEDHYPPVVRERTLSMPPADPPEYGSEEDVLFPPDQAYEAREALLELIATGNVKRFGLNPLTGLPRYLYGNLRESFDEPETYLWENQLLLTGLSEEVEVPLQRWRTARWSEGWDQYTYVQTNGDGVPIYGGLVTCNVGAGRLIYVDNNLYPALPGWIDYLEWSDPEWLSSPEDLQGLDFEIKEFEQPLALNQWAFRDVADKWILPPNVESPSYRPVWRTQALDVDGNRWLLLVEAQTNLVLHSSSAGSGASIETEVYNSAQDALDERKTVRSLDYGSGTVMEAADRVHMSGERFVDPADDTADEQLRLLSATAYYHARRVQEHFNSVLDGLEVSLLTTSPSPIYDLSVVLEEKGGEAWYDLSNGKHSIRLFSGKDDDPPVHEPGLDAEVIYHEFTHAVTHYLNLGIFQGNAQKARAHELDEGIAFYFACAFTDNPQWGEFAYSDPGWSRFRNLEQEESEDDEGGPKYEQGMNWARCFWALRQELGAEAGRYILRAFMTTNPFYDETVFADALRSQAADDDKEELVASILKDRGFLQ